MTRARRAPHRPSLLSFAVAAALCACASPAFAQAAPVAATTQPLSASPNSSYSVLDPNKLPFGKRPPTAEEEAQAQGLFAQLPKDLQARDLSALRRNASALLAVFDQSYGPEHPVRAKLAAQLGGAFYQLHALDEAAALFEPALAVLETNLGQFHHETIAVASAYTHVLVDQDVPFALGNQHPSLYWLLTRSHAPMEVGESLADADWLEAAALIAHEQRNFEAAEERRRRVLAIRSKLLPAGDARIGGAKNRLAASLAELGRADEAEALANQALANFNAQPDAPLAATGTVYDTLAKARLLRGQPAEAEALFRKALETRQRLLGKEHPAALLSEAELARFLRAHGREREAAPIFESLLSRRAAAGARGSRAVAAMLDFADGLHDAASCKALSKTMADMHQSLGVVSPLPAARIAETLGNLYMCEGRHAEAVQAYEAANQAFFLGKSWVNSPEFGLANARYALRLSGEVATLDAASRFAGQAATVANSRRRRGFANSDAPGFESALGRALHSVGGGNPLAVAYEAQLAVGWLAHTQGHSWGTAQGFVAAQLLDVSGAAMAMAQTAARVAAGEGPLAQRARRQQELAAQAIALDRELAVAIAHGDEAQIGSVTARLQSLGAELELVATALATDFPEYAELVSPEPLKLLDLQARLGEDEGLLLIVPSRGDLHVFAISKTAARWQRIAGGAESIGKHVARLRCQVDPATCGGGGGVNDRGVQSVYGTAVAQGGKSFDRDTAHRLYRELLAPVEPALAKAKRVFVTTAGALGQLPLGMLVTAAPVAGESDADADVLARSAWLADRYALLTLPAVSALRAPRARGGVDGGGFLGFGAPQLAGTAGAARGATGARLFARSAGPGQALADVETVRRLAPLPGTQVELQAMASLFGEGAQLVLGAQATEGKLKASTELGRAKVLAFATHGLLPRELRGMDEPGLVFTPPATASVQDDGVLTASEATKLSLAAEWIILSACNTAAGEGDGGDSLSGLAKSFLYAGAESLMASHWRVADDATAALTTETLAVRRATPGLSRAQALQAAMRTVRTGKRADGSALPGWKPAWSHPAAWAPFVLISDRDR